MNIEQRAVETEVRLSKLVENMTAIRQRGEALMDRIKALEPAEVVATLPVQLTELIDSDVEVAQERIGAAVVEQLGELKQLLGLDDMPEEVGEGAYSDLATIVEDVKALAGKTAEDIAATFEDAVASCGERLESVFDSLVDAVERWSNGLTEAAQNLQEGFENLDDVAAEAWSSTADQLRGFIDQSTGNLQGRITNLSDRIDRLGQQIEAGVEILSTSQQASASAMSATQGPLEVCLGIVDDTRAIFNSL